MATARKPLAIIGTLLAALVASRLALAESPAPDGDGFRALIERQAEELDRLTRQVEAMAAARIAALKADPAYQESFIWYRLDGGKLTETAFARAYLTTDGFLHGRLHPDDVARCAAVPSYSGPERQDCPMRQMPGGGTPGVQLGYDLHNGGLRQALDAAADLPAVQDYDRRHRAAGKGGSRRYVAWLYVRSHAERGDADPAVRLLRPVLRTMDDDWRR